MLRTDKDKDPYKEEKKVKIKESADTVKVKESLSSEGANLFASVFSKLAAYKKYKPKEAPIIYAT